MEIIKRNAALMLCTLAIMATLIGCTWWLDQSIARNTPADHNYHDELAGLGSRLDHIDTLVGYIDQRISKPSERSRYDQLNPPADPAMVEKILKSLQAK